MLKMPIFGFDLGFVFGSWHLKISTKLSENRVVDSFYNSGWWTGAVELDFFRMIYPRAYVIIFPYKLKMVDSWGCGYLKSWRALAVPMCSSLTFPVFSKPSLTKGTLIEFIEWSPFAGPFVFHHSDAVDLNFSTSSWLRVDRCVWKCHWNLSNFFSSISVCFAIAVLRNVRLVQSADGLNDLRKLLELLNILKFSRFHTGSPESFCPKVLKFESTVTEIVLRMPDLVLFHFYVTIFSKILKFSNLRTKYFC